MIHQRTVNLNPQLIDLEMFKITYPRIEGSHQAWRIQPMRFVPHSGKVSA
jgi:hypothetical protein